MMIELPVFKTTAGQCRLLYGLSNKSTCLPPFIQMGTFAVHDFTQQIGTLGQYVTTQYSTSDKDLADARFKLYYYNLYMEGFLLMTCQVAPSCLFDNQAPGDL